MDYHRIKSLKENNPTVRLLNADNGPLIISFLFQVFKNNNKITISNDDLVSNLADYIYSIRNSYGEELFPNSPQEYLDSWANDQYLRKYYPSTSDEPCFELTPASEKAIEWLKDLERREFVGTESRLIKIIDLLKEIVIKNSKDANVRIAELERKRDEIEEEIRKIHTGVLENLTPTQIKERYYEIFDTSNKLLADFRQIEYNFRLLDQEIRKKQISALQKGAFLKNFFEDHDVLLDSDQGKSFKAFWELLMSNAQQDELDKLIDLAIHLPEIQEIIKDDTLEGLKNHLLEAGYRVNKTNHILAEQLRKYLDDRTYLDNKVILDLIKEIKSIAIEIKNNPPSNKDFMIIPGRPGVEMIMERPLWDVSISPELSKEMLETGSSTLVDPHHLYSIFEIDPDELKNRIREFLSTTSQFTIETLVQKYPVEHGLAEIVIYVDLALKSGNVIVNDEVFETMVIRNSLSQRQFEVKIPQIIISR
jgi:hypothetical protein